MGFGELMADPPVERRFADLYCLAIIRDVAKAISVAHSADIAHRELSPLAVQLVIQVPSEEMPLNEFLVQAMGGCVAKVSGWDRASGLIEGSTRTVVFGEENEFAENFAAPEVGLPGFHSVPNQWQLADLWSLGKMIEWVWQEAFPAGSRPMHGLEKLVTILTDPDPGTREGVSAFEVYKAATTEFEKKSREYAGYEGGVVPILDVQSKPIVGDKDIGAYEEGDSIGETCKVVAKLGRGRAGEVYHVVDTAMEFIQPEFALKVFREEINRDVVQVEFAAMMNINNRHIVQVFSIDTIPQSNNAFGLRQQFVRGQNLRDCLNEGTLPEQAIIILHFRDLLEALCELHDASHTYDHQVIHRDIKPENLIYNQQDGLVLIDFSGASVEQHVQRQNMGSLSYRHGDFAKTSRDPALDVFSFAVTFHEVLTGGAHPFENMEVCVGDPTIDSELPPSLQEFFSNSLSKDADKRYKSAVEMLEVLGGAIKSSESQDHQEARRTLEHDQELDERTRQVLTDTSTDTRIELGPKVALEVIPGVDHTVQASSPKGETDVVTTVRRACIHSLNNNVDSIRLDLEWCQTEYGEIWIQVISAHDSPQCIQRLVHGLRAGIHPIPDGTARPQKVFMELRQARIIDDPDWPRLKKVPIEVLDEGAGVQISDVLHGLGADSVDTRRGTWGDTSNRRGDLCVGFMEDDVVIPLAAYALTRVAPLIERDGSDR